MEKPEVLRFSARAICGEGGRKGQAVGGSPALEVAAGHAPAAASLAAGAGRSLETHLAEKTADVPMGDAGRVTVVPFGDGAGEEDDLIGGEYELGGGVWASGTSGTSGTNGTVAEGLDDEEGEIAGFEVGPFALVVDGQGDESFHRPAFSLSTGCLFHGLPQRDHVFAQRPGMSRNRLRSGVRSLGTRHLL